MHHAAHVLHCLSGAPCVYASTSVTTALSPICYVVYWLLAIYLVVGSRPAVTAAARCQGLNLYISFMALSCFASGLQLEGIPTS